MWFGIHYYVKIASRSCSDLYSQYHFTAGAEDFAVSVSTITTTIAEAAPAGEATDKSDVRNTTLNQ